jgi:hypothetical protein
MTPASEAALLYASNGFFTRVLVGAAAPAKPARPFTVGFASEAFRR